MSGTGMPGVGNGSTLQFIGPAALSAQQPIHASVSDSGSSSASSASPIPGPVSTAAFKAIATDGARANMVSVTGVQTNGSQATGTFSANGKTYTVTVTIRKDGKEISSNDPVYRDQLRKVIVAWQEQMSTPEAQKALRDYGSMKFHYDGTEGKDSSGNPNNTFTYSLTSAIDQHGKRINTIDPNLFPKPLQTLFTQTEKDLDECTRLIKWDKAPKKAAAPAAPAAPAPFPPFAKRTAGAGNCQVFALADQIQPAQTHQQLRQKISEALQIALVDRSRLVEVPAQQLYDELYGTQEQIETLYKSVLSSFQEVKNKPEFTTRAAALSNPRFNFQKAVSDIMNKGVNVLTQNDQKELIHLYGLYIEADGIYLDQTSLQVYSALTGSTIAVIMGDGQGGYTTVTYPTEVTKLDLADTNTLFVYFDPAAQHYSSVDRNQKDLKAIVNAYNRKHRKWFWQ